MEPLANWITDFGDSAVLLPIAAACFFALLSWQPRRTAFAWAVAIGLCGMSMILLKLGMHACGQVIVSDGTITSPSGHTALSTTVYGALTVLLVGSLDRLWPRLGAALLGILAVGAIAFSRILVLAHTPQEVMVGLVVGLACVGVFALGHQGGRLAKPRLAQLGLIVVVALVFLHGQRANAESVLIQLAHLLRGNISACG
ncbi:MAG TPA: phosphatase PAP2 family protein [Stellaceae bacterium]|nr:phosphatase PAP2 family protein [Stellaceae bacterium]